MAQQSWHVVWNTLGEWPPHDVRGDWSELAAFYAPLVAAGQVAPSSQLKSKYTSELREAVLLSQDDAADLRAWLAELTDDVGDRVAGGHALLAAAMKSTRVHVLLRCERDKLSQVVGRLKSRLAGLLLQRPRWSKKGPRIWGRGFWSTEVLHDGACDRIKTFVESQDLFKHLVPESERPAYFHPEYLPRAALEAAFKSGDGNRAYYAFLNAAYFHEYDWVQAKSIEALASPVAQVRLGGLDALQILVGVRRELDPLLALPAITPLLDDPDEDVREKAEEVLSDIRGVLGQ